MPDFRYAQFCPLARAAEIVGERWTLLIVRELLIGPKRFSDLQGPLPGVSTSVLADRLAKLEDRGLVRRTELPPPAAATVYELTGSGRDLLPTVIELARWGTRYLGIPEAGDHTEPGWLTLAILTLARRGPSPLRTYRVTASDGARKATVLVAGGPDGTEIVDDDGESDLSLSADIVTLLAVASGMLPASQAVESGSLTVEGELTVLDDFAALFEVTPPTPDNEQGA